MSISHEKYVHLKQGNIRDVRRALHALHDSGDGVLLVKAVPTIYTLRYHTSLSRWGPRYIPVTIPSRNTRSTTTGHSGRLSTQNHNMISTSIRSLYISSIRIHTDSSQLQLHKGAI